MEGNEFNIITDCKAAELIYKNPCSKPPIRIQRWALRLSPFHFKISHKPGKSNIADSISRRPSDEPELDERNESHVNAIISLSIPKTMTKFEIIQETKRDKTLQKVMKEVITNGDFNAGGTENYYGIKDSL